MAIVVLREDGQTVHDGRRAYEVGQPTGVAALRQTLQQRRALSLRDPQPQEVLRQTVHVSVRHIPDTRHHARAAKTPSVSDIYFSDEQTNVWQHPKIGKTKMEIQFFWSKTCIVDKF